MDKTVLVLVTHEHADHYDPVIHQWEDYTTDVRYIYGWKAFDEGSFIYFNQPHQKKAGQNFSDIRIVAARNKGDRYLFKDGVLKRIDLAKKSGSADPAAP